MTLKFSKFILVGILLSFGFIISSCIKDITETNKDNTDRIVKVFGGSNIDMGTGITACNDGGFAIAATMKTSAYLSQAVLIRTDKYGNNLPWSPFYLDDTTSTTAYHLLSVSDGGFLITGSILKKESGFNNLDVMVAKVKADGTIAWLKSYGGKDNDEGYCSVELNDGSFMIGGYTSSFGHGKKDAYVIKINNNGTIIQSFTYGGTEDDECRSLIDFGTRMLLVGSSKSFQAAYQNIFIAKIKDDNGGIIDNVLISGTSDLKGVKALMEPNGDIDVMSNYSANNSNSGIYMLKLDSGNIHTFKTAPKFVVSNNNTLQQMSGNDILINNDKLIILGTSGTTSDYNYLLLNIDLNFNMISQQIFNSSGNQTAQSGALTTDGKIAFTGSNVIGGISKISLIKTDLPK